MFTAESKAGFPLDTVDISYALFWTKFNNREISTFSWINYDEALFGKSRSVLCANNYADQILFSYQVNQNAYTST